MNEYKNIADKLRVLKKRYKENPTESLKSEIIKLDLYLRELDNKIGNIYSSYNPYSKINKNGKI